MHKGFAKLGIVLMVLTSAVAVMGMGFGLWTQVLTVSETVNTGTVSLEYTLAFTDDDGIVDDPAFDSLDASSTPVIFDAWGPLSSADPSAVGVDPKSRYDKDVGICNASVGSPQSVDIVKTDVYPSYHCTAWMDIQNFGTIPVKVKSIGLVVGTSSPALIAPFGTSTPIVGVDLDGDLLDDLEVTVTGIQLCQQVDPGQSIRIDLDQHMLQDAPQSSILSYTVEVVMAQWNELGNAVVADECVFTGA